MEGQREEEQLDPQTFLVRVLYRQNATWQGTVDRATPDGGTESRTFRSALELLRLMDEAVRRAKTT